MMSNLNVFIHVSVDGFFAGPRGEIDWFKSIEKDAEYDAFTHERSKSGGALLFGHTTYEMMKSYWPTPDASKSDPDMAAVMHNSRKIVISKTLDKIEEGPNWKNIILLREITRKEIEALKERERNDITILGSGSIVQQLANLRMIDQYGLVVVPNILGTGKYLFKGVDRTALKLLQARPFKNGIIFLAYGASRDSRPQSERP
jgi:dihydrofolate reductase